MKRTLIRPAVVALAIAAAALACSAATIDAASASSAHAATQSTLAGKWKGHYGGAVSGHFTLHWRQSGSQLHGTITLSRPSGTYGISGSVSRGKIKFGAVGVGARYKGTVRGNTMSGTWTSGEGGGTWSAAKSS